MADLQAGGPLDVVGELTIESGGKVARVEASGDTIVVELPSLRSSASFVGGWSRLRERARRFGPISAGLVRAGLTVQVVVRSQTIAQVGARARPGRLAKLLGLGWLEIRSRSLLGLLRRSTDRREG